MKLGNTSQGIIPVPDFYLTKNVLEMDVFKLTSGGKKMFKEKDLFKNTKDINLSNNFRNKTKIFEDYNKEKYIPIHRRKIQLSPLKIDDIKEENKYIQEYEKFKEYMKKTSEPYTNPELVSEIKNNINSLLERINSNFDIESWNKANSQNMFNKMTKIEFSNITTFNQENTNEADNFKNHLVEKIKTMKCDLKDNTRENLLSTFTKYSSSQNKESTTYTLRSNTSQKDRKSELSIFERNLKKTNQLTYDRFKGTSSFSDYPSATRTEFTRKIGEKISFKRRNLAEESKVDPLQYNSLKNKGIYTDDYDINSHAFKKLNFIKTFNT